MFCYVIDLVLTKFVYMPPHAPSTKRLNIAWYKGRIQRFIAVMEEGECNNE
jgi:hypothetical protein